jgi:hypothetical protein
MSLRILLSFDSEPNFNGDLEFRHRTVYDPAPFRHNLEPSHVPQRFCRFRNGCLCSFGKTRG